MADEFGELLKQLREKAGRSQPELAEACGVPVASLRNWEQGRRRPDLGTAYRLAKALRVPLDALGQAADRSPLRGKDGPLVATQEKPKAKPKK
jgi:transcriptional regulator with XRE-family HTH domain